MTQTKHQMNSQDMLMIHELASNAAANNSYGQAAVNEIDQEAGLKIYLRAVDKIELALNEIKDLFEEVEKFRRSRKENEQALKNAEITEKLMEVHIVVDEFIKGFSVVHDEAAKDFMILFLNRFNFLDENLRLLMVNRSPRYLDDCFKMLARVRATFEKMLEITQNPPQNSNNEPAEVENSEVSV